MDEARPLLFSFPSSSKHGHFRGRAEDTHISRIERQKVVPGSIGRVYAAAVLEAPSLANPHRHHSCLDVKIAPDATGAATFLSATPDCVEFLLSPNKASTPRAVSFGLLDFHLVCSHIAVGKTCLPLSRLTLRVNFKLRPMHWEAVLRRPPGHGTGRYRLNMELLQYEVQMPANDVENAQQTCTCRMECGAMRETSFEIW